MNLFSKKKAAASAPPPPSPVETINFLRESLNTLEKREEHILKKMEQSTLEARTKLKKNDKNGALFALKRKKLYEVEINKLQGARITLDSQILSLESAAVNLETFKAMKAGANAMKGMRGDIDADAVDEIMDDIQEEKDIHDSISDAISRPGQFLFDDEELLNELNELDELELDENISTTTKKSEIHEVNINLPSVPVSSISSTISSATINSSMTTKESEDEKALRELEASMFA